MSPAQQQPQEPPRDNLPAIPVAPDHLPPAERAGRVMEAVIAAGDLGQLGAQNRARYYVMLCQSLGLNPMTQPFQYITLNGKLTLYPRKEAAEQLGRTYAVSTEVTDRQMLGELFVVTVRASTPDGRHTDSQGIVAAGGLKGEALANALMKAESKGKRRGILSLIGLGWMDSGAGDEGDGSGVRHVDTDRHGNVLEEAREYDVPPVPVSKIGEIFGDDRPAARPPGVPDPLSAYAAAAPIAERQASGKRPKPAAPAAPNREPTGDEVVDYFRGPDPAPAGETVEGEGRELPEEETAPPAPAPEDVKLRCAALVDEILAAVPTAKPKLPADSEPLAVWEKWETDTRAKWDASPNNPANAQAAAK